MYPIIYIYTIFYFLRLVKFSDSTTINKKDMNKNKIKNRKGKSNFKSKKRFESNNLYSIKEQEEPTDIEQQCYDPLDRAFEKNRDENVFSSDFDIVTEENANKKNQLVEKTNKKGKKKGSNVIKRLGAFTRSFWR